MDRVTFLFRENENDYFDGEVCRIIFDLLSVLNRGLLIHADCERAQIRFDTVSNIYTIYHLIYLPQRSHVYLESSEAFDHFYRLPRSPHLD